MNNINLEGELNIAKKAALAAGDILKKNKGDLNKTTFESSKDIKLEADISAEKLIKAILSKESAFPILAEESGKSADNLGSTFWVVDPLDGTANYSRDIPICCVSIALIKDLEPVMGVIYDFNNDDLYEGSIYQSALLNGNVLNTSSITKPRDGILVTGLPNNTDYSDEAMLKMIKDFQDWKKVRMIGSAAMASVYVASGKADLYKEFGTYLWDIAAGAAIINAAGGRADIKNRRENFQVDAYFSNSKIVE
ncbi:inositol monophosphatase [Gammaproteobacteria bacterium]|jgi:myo-inositol-1(or 4)-monophosphatase|nr:inositol monophosphatase [Gammaproteobacteria bacterium]